MVFKETHSPREININTTFIVLLCLYRTVDNYRIKIQLWDTAGQERFRSMAPMYYRKANAAFIVYDITSYASFESAKSWVEGKYRLQQKI